MIAYNPFRHNAPVELNIDLNLNNYEFHIQHETPFTERHSEWAVTILDTADMVYIPSGNNRCRNIYIVTWEYTSKELRFPDGIYTIPMNYFTHEF